MLIHWRGIGVQTAVCHTFFFFTNSFTYKYLLQLVIGLIQGFWFLKQHKYWVIAKTPVGTQRQGDSVERQYSWGHNTGLRAQKLGRRRMLKTGEAASWQHTKNRLLSRASPQPAGGEARQVSRSMQPLLQPSLIALLRRGGHGTQALPRPEGTMVITGEPAE